MDLHYSQTRSDLINKLGVSFTTLWIYTILKRWWNTRHRNLVLLPYGFTLFSNNETPAKTEFKFYYLMDLHYSQTKCNDGYAPFSFTTLWIYTILKLIGTQAKRIGGFTTLWIYTILKRLLHQ